ncbi:hypothetical protein E5D57_004722 [Metarhizium anisopliae]|nr:hypothetical protein E5D57_004722 [Metarhizium anisopliae]
MPLHFFLSIKALFGCGGNKMVRALHQGAGEQQVGRQPPKVKCSAGRLAATGNAPGSSPWMESGTPTAEISNTNLYPPLDTNIGGGDL